MDSAIRPMTTTDLEAACSLWSNTNGVELAEGDSVEELSRYLLRNPGSSFVAWHDGKLVGAVLAGHDGRRGFLYHLAVSVDCRGRGIGRALVTHALSALKTAGMARVLILVAQDNPSGREFWSGQGWEPLDFAEAMGIDL